MRIKFQLLLCILITASCGSDPENTSLDCTDFWASVPFSNFCDMEFSHFDTDGVVDICGAEDNASFPYAERIFINVYNGFSEAGAREDHENEREFAQTSPDYVEMSGVGDDAFAIVTLGFADRLDVAYISVLKGQYTITIEVNADVSNGANNCLDENTIFDFARAIANSL